MTKKKCCCGKENSEWEPASETGLLSLFQTDRGGTQEYIQKKQQNKFNVILAPFLKSGRPKAQQQCLRNQFSLGWNKWSKPKSRALPSKYEKLKVVQREQCWQMCSWLFLQQGWLRRSQHAGKKKWAEMLRMVCLPKATKHCRTAGCRSLSDAAGTDAAPFWSPDSWVLQHWSSYKIVLYIYSVETNAYLI